jgi:hypothetical protein
VSNSCPEACIERHEGNSRIINLLIAVCASLAGLFGGHWMYAVSTYAAASDLKDLIAENRSDHLRVQEALEELSITIATKVGVNGTNPKNMLSMRNEGKPETAPLSTQE